MNKVRHPEKQKNQINPIKKKPAWIKSKLLNSKEFFLTKSIVNQQKLVTVCEEQIVLTLLNVGVKDMQLL